jgi:hypothetical protein
MSAVESPAEQQEPVAVYIVFAKDGTNEDRTAQMLQDLVGKDNVSPPFIFRNRLQYWLSTSKSPLPFYFAEVL